MTKQGGLATKIAERIRREGPITFADYMAFALYDEDGGFFATGGGAGRAGRDFVTSPEVGSLFGMLMARSLDEAWHRLGEPDPFVVIEAGAGTGQLAADVLRAAPACSAALRYVLVERSPVLRSRQRERLELEPPDEALGPFLRPTDPDDRPEPMPASGPIVTALDDLPSARIDGVVLANELLDNLPVRIVERAAGGWSELRVALDDDGRFVETIVPGGSELSIEADAVAAGVAVATGARLPVPTATRDWLATVAAVLRRGEVIVVDYADDVAGLLARGQRGPAGWLRTYRAHGRGTDPLDAPGTQDVTCDVPLEYLRDTARRVGFTRGAEATQADWLRGLGIDELVEQGAATWRERAHLGDLEAVAGRSRAVEAAALTDPTGLGAHRVLILQREGGDSRGGSVTV